MNFRPRRRETRRAGSWAAALALLLGAGVVALDGSAPAQAFDCKGAVKCPFVKIEKIRPAPGPRPYANDLYYQASATLLDNRGNPVHEWQEDDPTFTLWHWRYHGGGGQVKITVYVSGVIDNREFSVPPSHFTTDADTSICIKVDHVGAYQSGGCTDYEDPAR